MPVYKDSRYALGTVNYVALQKDGEVFPIVRYRPNSTAPDNPKNASYVCTHGDRFDNLALKFYGDHRQWWKIAEKNPHVKNIHLLTPGEVIIIP